MGRFKGFKVLICLLVLSGLVSGECIQYVTINDLLGEDALDDMVFVYQNDNMSRRFIKSENYTMGEFNINCNVTYQFYIRANPDLTTRDMGNINWSNYIFYSFTGAILMGFFIVVILLLIQYVRRRT